MNLCYEVNPGLNYGSLLLCHVTAIPVLLLALPTPSLTLCEVLEVASVAQPSLALEGPGRVALAFSLLWICSYFSNWSGFPEAEKDKEGWGRA